MQRCLCQSPLSASTFKSWLHWPRLQQLQVSQVKPANSKCRGVTTSWRIFYNHTSVLYGMTDGSCLRTAAYKRETQNEKELFKKKECCKQSPREWWCPRTIGEQLHTREPEHAWHSLHVQPYLRSAGWRSCRRVAGAQYSLNANFVCWSPNGMLGEHHHILFYPTLQDSCTTRIYFLKASQWLQTITGPSTEEAVKQKLLF